MNHHKKEQKLKELIDRFGRYYWEISRSLNSNIFEIKYLNGRLRKQMLYISNVNKTKFI
jgi:hypothetical protein